MKLNKLFTVTALALAGTALLPMAASAAVSASPGDLILGFELEGAASGTTDYEVDLGSALTYATPGYSNSDITAFSASDLASVASSPLTNSAVAYAIAGVSTVGLQGLYIGYQPGTIVPKTSNSQNAGFSDINQYTLALNGAASASTTEGTLAFNNSTPNGFTQALDNSNGNAFGQFTTNPEVPVTDTNGVAETTMDTLYYLPVAATKSTEMNGIALGTFTLNGSTGVLSYQSATAAAVPEPSAYALGLCAMILFWVLKRRHSVA